MKEQYEEFKTMVEEIQEVTEEARRRGHEVIITGETKTRRTDTEENHGGKAR